MPPTLTAEAGTLRALSRQDLARVDYSLSEVLEAVRGAFLACAEGLSANPRKLSVKAADGRSVAFAMLGRDGEGRTVAFKTSYKFTGSADGGQARAYYTSLLLYDDATGLPIALMDCSLVGALRTPAASALIARACARRDAETALVVGCGTQGQNALPFLVEAMPQLRRLILHGRHEQGLQAALDRMRYFHPQRQVELSHDLRASALAADIIVGASGPASAEAVREEWVKPGAVAILVGHGLHADILHEADYRVATSVAQMQLTGTDLADPQGVLPGVDAELPGILLGRQPGRVDGAQRIFAYNSGMVVTDIAVGRLLAERALAQGLGQAVHLWR